MRHRKTSKRARADPHEPETKLAERVQAERERLFKASSIIACCRLACASKLIRDDPEMMADALQASCDLIGTACAGLESLADVLSEAGSQHRDPTKLR